MTLSARITSLAEAIGADIKALVAGKVDKVDGKALSANDYTDDDKAKLGSINPEVVAVGVGQSWQDLTASRNKSIPYTNSTGRPITVSVIRAKGAGSIALSISSIVMQKNEGNDLDSQGTVSGIVPSGEIYMVTGSSAIESWLELR